jgi:hypothetical protein
MRRIIAFIFVLICGHNILSAAHIVGGDVTYACIESNPVTKSTKFRVTFTLFRDLAGNGAAFDNQLVLEYMKLIREVIPGPIDKRSFQTQSIFSEYLMKINVSSFHLPSS